MALNNNIPMEACFLAHSLFNIVTLDVEQRTG